jgi:hypothetical protein
MSTLVRGMAEALPPSRERLLRLLEHLREVNEEQRLKILRLEAQLELEFAKRQSPTRMSRHPREIVKPARPIPSDNKHQGGRL